MEKVMPNSSGQRFPNNISVQTGEEFSMDFLQDRPTQKGTALRHDFPRGLMKRVEFDADQNFQPSYEKITDIHGFRRSDSDCNAVVSNTLLTKGTQDANFDKSGRIQTENDCKIRGNSVNEFSESSSVSEIMQGCHRRLHESGTSDGSFSDKLKLLCSFGGKILPRPGDGQLRYVGGETRIISIRKKLSWRELVQKTSSICNQPHTIRYQLPGEDLDALISVSSDEDLQNMMEEYHGLEKADGSQRLRIFLIPLNESESCSLDTRALHNSSEYHYVVAVNNILDASLHKSSSGNSLSSQWGYQLDGSPRFQNDSHGFAVSEATDGTHAPNILGRFLHHPASPLFINPQAAGLSPPFSPKPILNRDSKHSQKQSFADQLNVEQPSDNYHAIDTGCCIHGPATKLHPNMLYDSETQIRPYGVHFQNHKHTRDLGHSPIYCNEPNFGVYSYGEGPGLKERGFHSEMFPREEDSMSWMLGSNGLDGPVQGMPHAYSDSSLQEQGVKNASNLTKLVPTSLDLTTQPSSPKLHQTNFEGKGSPFVENTEKINSKHPFILERALSESSSARGHALYINNENLSGRRADGRDPGLQISQMGHGLGCDASKGMDEKEFIIPNDKDVYHIDLNAVAQESVTCKGRLLVDNYHLSGNHSTHVSRRELEILESSVSVPSLLVPNTHSDHKENSLGKQLERGIDDKLKHLKSSGIDESSSTAWCKTSPGSEITNGIAAHKANEHCNGIKHNDLMCNSSSDPFSYPPPVIMPQNSKNNLEPGLASSANSAPLVRIQDSDPTLNLHLEDPPSWSLPQNSVVGDKDLRREVSLLDQDIVNNPGSNLRDMHHGTDCYEHLNGVETEPPCTSHDQVLIGAAITVEDVTNGVPSGIPEIRNIVPQVHHEVIDDVDTSDTLSLKENDVENSYLDLEHEDAKVDGETNESMDAEKEAGIYGLQIIKNADLEEIRELGSGTFGTVYYGKWRGTDVAIKRIKKSCFAGRSSEQDRLTKDFWREAQILSKLHHPNVVAFYGVVPDGTGGTLATVTEFMVNGSLRHVLLKKERALDRRKRLIIAMDAAFGMEYLHSKNIVHFDLKCDNLLVNMRDSQRPICKVGDFGLSRIKRNTLVSGGVRGTLPWMAPELLNGSSSRVSDKVDVFSFGIVMWEIFTGEEPYANMHCGAIIGGIVNNTLRPPIPDRCDSEWRKLMEQCWSPDPLVRPTFTEITNRLRAMASSFQPEGHNQINR
ncbi:uncharacterized protein LOC120259616 [Dioscorea cayenensis subsp. rotundata]|uniref:Uncharacterized protein LOC120259616 n=1 Tax=Dioscorea cayennensis subsp. rotundata TaxID=55577 RepID=A0AB40B7X7_DIOCR|nr:uncharacterized protein LOC120259616 [Dioscorea cayenensis subsp. rotundata]XP_039123173.1 uncharacterized protein LOC120259616 [Dioscorea cayenensis subsp. rotundata]XP_039123174.1 uncharacterized protein LOC120259616 [Dioscorea cayenensis subsp. rotundata]XP_039123175.1 uncharacterized protein LOC120259616 [Dioscorea cayenensis subsp. rotundata]XP_039123176.1 uncharacterized protein LOC120259616 [Dioscorea cayenensis subsp. rotundata]XP_039123177.1 uncharacterized protein LOC120259616 [Di